VKLKSKILQRKTAMNIVTVG